MPVVSETISAGTDRLGRALFVLLVGVLLLAVPACLFAQTQFSTSEDGSTMTVDDAPDMEVVAFGKTVIVKQRAKGVAAIGGDIIVEGSVSGDVGTIGGSITQRGNAYIGGDVIAIGGKYKAESEAPLREAGKKTVMVGMFEDELREIGQNPTELFSPDFSLSFLAMRLVSVLFWFVVSFGLTTLAPGAVGRAIARFQLSTLRVFAIGMLTLVVTLVGILVGVKLLPNYLSVSIFLMAFVLLVLAFVFGRVALQLSIGKFIQKHLVPNANRSESLAILFGVLFWTVLLSIPYIWTMTVLALFVAGLGLVLTARTTNGWRHS